MRDQIVFRNNVMFYRWEDYNAIRYLLTVPYALQEEVLRMNHDVRDTGHTGQVNNFYRVRQAFIGLGCTAIFTHMSKPAPSAKPTTSLNVTTKLN